jgi:hypothetical protein
VTKKKKRKAAAPREKKAKPAAKNASRGKAAAGDGRGGARPTAPLFDTDRFRRHIEPAYRTMREIIQRGEPPRAFPADPLPPGQ